MNVTTFRHDPLNKTKTKTKTPETCHIADV